MNNIFAKQEQKFDSECFFLKNTERRIIFDYEKYGDSPVCLNKNRNVEDQLGITQGYGLTENGLFPSNVLETNVTIISNEECYQNLQNETHIETVKLRQSLYDGVNEQILCTLGLLKTIEIDGMSETIGTVSYTDISKLTSSSKNVKF